LRPTRVEADRLSELAADLVRRRVAVILALGRSVRGCLGTAGCIMRRLRASSRGCLARSRVRVTNQRQLSRPACRVPLSNRTPRPRQPASFVAYVHRRYQCRGATARNPPVIKRAGDRTHGQPRDDPPLSIADANSSASTSKRQGAGDGVGERRAALPGRGFIARPETTAIGPGPPHSCESFSTLRQAVLRYPARSGP
jgi:hypothetical protein